MNNKAVTDAELAEWRKMAAHPTIKWCGEIDEAVTRLIAEVKRLRAENADLRCETPYEDNQP